MDKLDLGGLFNSDSMTDQDVAMSWLKKQKVTQEELGGRDPYRSSLAGLFAQRKVLLNEVKAKLGELARLNSQIEHRAQMVLVGYTGVGRLGRWLLGRAWKRIFRSHDASLSNLLSGMPKGHCADHWECKHTKEIDCDEVRTERESMVYMEGKVHTECESLVRVEGKVRIEGEVRMMRGAGATNESTFAFAQQSPIQRTGGQ